MSFRRSLGPLSSKRASSAEPAGGDGEGGGHGDDVLTVAALDARMRAALRTLGVVWTVGEVSGFRGPAPSGHLYFNLKDEHEDAVVACAMYRRDAQIGGGDRVANGARLKVRGEPSLYAPRGSLQLIVSRVEPAGLGDLLAEREERKRRLAAEGLFDPARKRPLPSDPRVVGVVTSPAGAAFADIVKVAMRRTGVRVLLAPSQVQGAEAPAQLVAALAKLAAVAEVDVIIIGRGGGSAEDLAAFDDESVVRAIAACPKPVVAAVGHEIDWSISCLAADVRAATPSQAAELVVPDASARRTRLDDVRRRLGLAMLGMLRHDQAVLARLTGKLRAPERALALHRQRVDELHARAAAAIRTRISEQRSELERRQRRLAARHPRAVVADARRALAPTVVRLRAAMARRLLTHRSALTVAARRLDALSPLAILSRGYAIVLGTDERGERQAIRRAESVKVDDLIEVRLADGELSARVTGSRPR